MNKKLAVAAAFTLCMISLCGCRLVKNAPGRPNLSPLATPSTAPGIPSATPGTVQTAAPDNYLLVTPEATESPAPTEQRIAGEIPDAQEFMNYTSSVGGYDVQVPETWTPSVSGEDIKFTHSYNGIRVQIIRTTEPYTMETIKNVYVSELVRKGRAVAVKNVSMAATKSGQAIMVEYESNSEPVNGKKVRLENRRYYYYKDGRLAALTMWAPLGADNENIWKQIPDTFLWR